MNIVRNFDFTKQSYEDLANKITIRNRKDNIINYYEFILENPITKLEFPEFDKPFFDRMNATLKHKLHCFKEGWIQSERQIFYSSDECMTTIQFIIEESWRSVTLNVFMRSSNLRNIDQDIQFLNYFLSENFPGYMNKLHVFVSMPHIFLDRTTKIG